MCTINIKQVEPIIGEAMRFWVQSSGDYPHLVDMNENNGNGECSCGDFKYKKIICFRNNGKRIVNYGFANTTRCKHINTVLVHLGNLVVNKYHEEINNNINATINHSESPHQ